MRIIVLLIGVTVFIVMATVVIAADNTGRIYGKIYTVDGEEFEGLIRWDRNEGSWVDLLNGTKELDSKARHRQSKRKYYGKSKAKIKLFGIEIGDNDGETWITWSGSAQSGIRFGHIDVMEIIDDDRVLLYLKSGEEVELYNGSTDLGCGIREIVCEDTHEGEIEFSWDDLDRIDFEQARGNEKSSFGERLYGTLTTRRGDEFTGYVCWDIDEIFTNDILDGDEKRRSRKIKFGKIESIERYSSSGAQIVLKSGDEMVLRGSNDVDDDNRGIIVSDPAFGQVTVEWDEFDKLEFHDPPKGIAYDKFDGGRRLKGTVYTEDGEEYTGEIRWDDDEEYTWEILDGEYRDIEFDIEFGLIKAIEKDSYRSSTVTVQDGREFRLRGSNDVDEDNKGIYVKLADGDEVLIDWDEFERVEFTRR